MIDVVDLGIKFKMEKRKRAKALDMIIARTRNRRSSRGEFWALRHVKFSVENGDTVGIIGRNGSGKSTLLRVIAGVYPPDEGNVTVQGKVSTLFSLGAGFQPELSGRDNIYLNGIMMGFTKRWVDKSIDTIIEFAELGEFIDMPVRTYSSGMRSRLGFSIAMHVDKDIVLIDEIMGAGDAAFRQKADIEMGRIIGEKTVLMVSHSMANIEKFANKVIWLDKGEIVAMGKPEDIIQEYLDALNVKKSEVDNEVG
jgi:ABC-type polysaccharide/polyol phosphate transport system ATPase subunit